MAITLRFLSIVMTIILPGSVVAIMAKGCCKFVSLIYCGSALRRNLIVPWRQNGTPLRW